MAQTIPPGIYTGPAGVVKLKGKAVVAGMVRSTGGVPLAGVTVVVQDPLGERGDFTDDDGHYEVTDVEPGAVIVRMFYGNEKLETIPVPLFADQRCAIDAVMITRAVEEWIVPHYENPFIHQDTTLGLVWDRGFDWYSFANFMPRR